MASPLGQRVGRIHAGRAARATTNMRPALLCRTCTLANSMKTKFVPIDSVFRFGSVDHGNLGLAWLRASLSVRVLDFRDMQPSHTDVGSKTVGDGYRHSSIFPTLFDISGEIARDSQPFKDYSMYQPCEVGFHFDAH